MKSIIWKSLFAGGFCWAVMMLSYMTSRQQEEMVNIHLLGLGAFMIGTISGLIAHGIDAVTKRRIKSSTHLRD